MNTNGLEALTILSEVNRRPGLLKGRLAAAAMDTLGRGESETRVFLGFIDDLLGIGYLTKHRFSYHLTPAGEVALASVQASTTPAFYKSFA